jgi:perosamine synthetase
MEVLPKILEIKHDVANSYKDFCKKNGIEYIDSVSGNTANNWLNTILVENENKRNDILEKTNAAGVMTRPIWTLLSELPAFWACQKDHLNNSISLSKRIINLPSSVPDSRILDL